MQFIWILTAVQVPLHSPDCLAAEESAVLHVIPPAAWDWLTSHWSASLQNKLTHNFYFLKKKKIKHKRYFIRTQPQKGLSRETWESPSKNECGIQILSWTQKHERVLKFPTHILSAWSLAVGVRKRAPALHEVCARGIIFSSIEWTADWDGLFVCQHEPAQVQDRRATLEALFQATSVSTCPATTHDGCHGCYPTCSSVPSHSHYSPFPSTAHQLKDSCQADICSLMYFI